MRKFRAWETLTLGATLLVYHVGGLTGFNEPKKGKEATLKQEWVGGWCPKPLHIKEKASAP
jgi:hypothetical protein